MDTGEGGVAVSDPTYMEVRAAHLNSSRMKLMVLILDFSTWK